MITGNSRCRVSPDSAGLLLQLVFTSLWRRSRKERGEANPEHNTARSMPYLSGRVCGFFLVMALGGYVTAPSHCAGLC